MGPWAGLVSGSSKETGSDYSLALEKKQCSVKI